MVTWTVTRVDGEPWEILNGDRLVDTVRAHYDARDVLALAERYAGGPMAWRLDDRDGFVSVGPVTQQGSVAP